MRNGRAEGCCCLAHGLSRGFADLAASASTTLFTCCCAIRVPSKALPSSGFQARQISAVEDTKSMAPRGVVDGDGVHHRRGAGAKGSSMPVMAASSIVISLKAWRPRVQVVGVVDAIDAGGDDTVEAPAHNSSTATASVRASTVPPTSPRGAHRAGWLRADGHVDRRSHVQADVHEDLLEHGGVEWVAAMPTPPRVSSGAEHGEAKAMPSRPVPPPTTGQPTSSPSMLSTT